MPARPDLIYLAHRIPYPPNKGDKIRSWNALKLLAARYRVHLGCFVDHPDDWQHTATVTEICGGDCLFVPLDPRRRKLASLRGLLTGEALSLPYYRNRDLARWTTGIFARHAPAAAVALSSTMAQYLMDVPAGTLRLMDMLDVDSDKWRQYATHARGAMRLIYRREGEHLQRFETRVAESFDATFLVSSIETELMRRLAPAAASRIHCLRNGVDTAYFSPDAAGATPFAAGGFAIVFTGAMDYWPNVDAVTWFATEILPGLRRAIPEASFHIVGSNPTEAVRALAGMPGIEVTGTVPDVRPYVAGAAVVVAPLRIARGVQNKVLEAMAMKKVVVTTTRALQGLDARPEDELLLADDPAGFTRQIERVRRCDVAHIPARARDHVLRNYGWTTNLSYLIDLIDEHQRQGRERQTKS
jgi:sugar transferase (PEP-CTERM/EpsH1 system associated)